MAIRYLSGIDVDSNTLFVDSANDRVGIGTTDPETKLHVVGLLQMRSSTEGGPHVYRDNDNAPDIRLYSTAGTFASPTAKANGGLVGQIHWAGYDGSAYVTGAQIWGVIDGAVNTGTMPTRLEFKTTTTSGPMERMVIKANGNVLIGTTTDSGQKLQVNGEGRFYQSATNSVAYLRVENNRSRNAALRLTTTVGDYYLGVGIGADVNQFQIYDGNAGQTRLTIASTGAATFSSSVTATNYISNATSGIIFDNTSGGTNATQIRLQNTGGNMRAGVESSTGETIQLGTLAYAAVFGNQANAATQFTTNGTTRITITSDGNVGIGTTSPDTKLQVIGNIGVGAGTYNGGIYANSSSSGIDSNWGFDIARTAGVADYSTRLKYYPNTGESRKGGIYNSLSNTWVLYGDSNNTPNVIIPTGNVGIGTTAPDYKLHIKGSSNYDGAIAIDNSTTTGGGALVIRQNGVNSGFISVVGSALGTSDRNLAYFAEAGLGHRFFVNDGTTALTITSGGNVGIGTSSPRTNEGTPLTLQSSDGYVGITLNGTGSYENIWQLYASGNAGSLKFLGMYDRTGGAYRLVATNTGNVLIGTTTDAGYKLDVNGSGRIAGQFIQGSGAARSTNGTTVALTYNTAYSANSDLADGGRFLSIVNESTVTNAYSALSFRVNPDNAGGGSNAMVDMKFVNANSSNSSTLIWTFLSGGSWVDRMALTSDGNVGIGTTSPTGKLSVRTDGFANTISIGGSTTADIGYLSFWSNSSPGRQLTVGGIDGIIFQYGAHTSPSEAMRISSAGAVGIGTTSPGTKLSVHANADEILHLSRTTSTGGDYVYMAFSHSDSSSSANTRARIGTNILTGGNGELVFDTRNSSVVSEKMRITAAGNVGIGTTSPLTQLHVNDGVNVSNLTMLTLSQLGNTSDRDVVNLKMSFNNGAVPGVMLSAIKMADAGSSLGLSTGNPGNGVLGERMRITAGGNVLIGTTTDGGYKLRVNGEILADDDIRILNTYALVLNGTDNNWRIGRNTITDTGWLTGNTMQMVVFGSSSGQGFQVVNSNGTALFEIDGVAGASRFSNALGVGVNPSGTSGRIDASNDIVAYSTSDSRLKENITPIANALDKVKSLTGVEFDWKEETKGVHGYEGHDVGVIAQEVQAVLPEAIRTNDTGYLSVRYEKMIALLIEGMKEQQNQIDELKAKLDGLTK
jgi:hypothetical protein